MHLFTYGTLMFPEVWQAVVGRDFATLPAQLPNFQIFRVQDAVFPGIIAVNPSPSGRGQEREACVTPPSALHTPPSSVPGLVYCDLDPESLAHLDAFEDDFYIRQTITVTCKDGQQLEAEAYIVPPESAHLLTDEIWTPEEFQARGHLAEFVARYSGFNRLHSRPCQPRSGDIK